VFDYRRSLELRPGDGKTRRRFIRLLITMRNFPAVEEHAQVLVDQGHDVPEVYLGRAAVARSRQRLDEARRNLDELYAKHPDYPFGRTLRAEFEFQDLRWAEAEKWARSAVEHEPLNSEAHYLLWKSLKAQVGREEEERRQEARWRKVEGYGRRMQILLHRDHSVRSRDPRVLLEVGEILLDVGLLDRAEQWFLRVLADNPRHVRANELLARCYEAGGRTELAAQHRALVGKSD
jgi:predicted Zn-dependent protease